LGHLDGERLRTLLTQAVAAYSPSYEEQPALRVFAERLAQGGLPPEWQPVPAPRPGTDAAAEDGVPPRANLLVRLGPQPPAMLWVGHVDTIEAVTPFQPPRRDGDRLHGLGAADMKSGCAAMVEAAIALHRSGIPLARGLCLALVVGEEEYGDGALALMDAVRAPLTVVSEPTDLQPCIAHNGYLECQLTAQGSRAHAAVPEVGANAIHAMLAWLMALYEQFLAPPLAGQAVLNPREIQGGSTLFAVPAECRAMVDLHWRPGTDRQLLLEAIEHARREAGAGHPLCSLASSVTFSSMGYDNPPGDPRLAPFWRACERTGIRPVPALFRSHSDAAVFQRSGSLAVVCGPGRLEMAHSAEEWVSLEQTEKAAKLYISLACEALT
jgi:acetylornithine deacetylase